MKYKKKLLVLAISSILSTGAIAQNVGFEDGNITGWSSSTTTAVGSQTVQAGSNTWAINPYGSYMGKVQIQTGSYSSMATALGLTNTSTTAIQSMLTTQAQTSGGNPNPTTAGWVTKQVTLTAGTQFTLAWQYVSVDYVPFNDGSIATLTQSGTNTATVNNYQQQYALLGFTNPGTGDYSTGSYGATGWQVATFDVSVDGTYTLGFGVFNMGDTALSPILFIDEVQGTTTKNGQSFGAVAPNNSTAPSASSVTPTPTPTPPTPSLTSTVGSGATATTDTLDTSVTVNGGTIQLATTGITLTNTFTVDSNGMTVDQNGKTGTFNGVLSGNGGVTISNTGSGGGITFAAVNTYTGSTTVNSGASLTNTGNIASSSSVTNNGTFTNSGTASSVTNNGVFVNDTTGVVASVVNTNDATNNGAVTGTVTNTGTFINSSTGTTGAVSNNTGGTFTNNGTTGNVNNAGTFSNSGTTGDVINTNSFTNTGFVATVTNGGTFSNSGTTGDVTNTGVFTSSGATGNVNNSGTFTYLGGNVGNVTNTGGLNVTGAGATVTLPNYTQSAPGSTLMNGNQVIVVFGTANLGGDLFVLNAPTGYGYHTYLTAGTIAGQYDTLTLNPDLYPLGYGLIYTGNSVQLKVTPSSVHTMNSINNNVGSVASVNNTLMGMMNGALGYDCAVFGDNNMCLSTGVYGLGGDGAKVGGGYVVLGRQLSPRWRAGLSVDQGFNKISVGNVSATTNTPSFGGFVNWNKNTDGQGLAVRASGSITSSNLTVNRSSSQYSEAATGNTSANGYAYQLKASYTLLPTSQRFNITPYVGLRHTSLAINGYTETGAVFPLTYNSLNQSTTDALVGTSVSYDFNDKLSGFVSAGIIKNLSYNAGAVSGTSGIYGLQTFNTPLPGSNYTSTTLGTGLTYDIAKTQFVTVSTGWQQKTLTNTSQITGAVSYTIGF